MKRHWRPGRIVLAVLLISLAALCFYAWPKQPLWSLSFDMAEDWYELLGIDEAKQIVYVNYVDHEDVNFRHPVNRRSELRGYQLHSGKLIWRLPDTDEVFKDSPLAWAYWLSPDRSQVVCHEHGNETLQVRAFPSCKLQYQIKLDKEEAADGLLACYSNDGSQILVITRKQVHFYDSSSGRLEDSLAIPDLPEPARLPEATVSESKTTSTNGGKPVGITVSVENPANHNWAALNGLLQLSDDKRFLAIAGSGMKSVLVFHLPSKKLLAQLPFSGIPRFLGKDNLLLLVPEFHLSETPVNNQLKRFMVSETGVTDISASSEYPTTKGETLLCDQRRLVTNEVQLDLPSSSPFWSKWDWLPDVWKVKLAMAIYSPQVRFDVYDPRSGKKEQTFHLPLSNIFYATYLQRNWLSSDAKLVALNDGTTLALWETSPGRSLLPWSILVGTIIVCLWLAWPRRMKVQKILLEAAST
ncbi:MAG: hypothetical protein QM703_25340 [Gemmatales bacterium]